MTATTEIPEWKQRARVKRAEQQERIPSDWRLPPLDPLPHNALSYIRQCPVLTPEELAITEIRDARTLLNRIATSGLSAVDVTRAFCKRAAVAQQLVGCCTEMIFEEALARAATLDRHLAETGKVIGPLHGLPISLKDNIDIKGHDSTWGKRISGLQEGWLPDSQRANGRTTHSQAGLD
jgi:amidase